MKNKIKSFFEVERPYSATMKEWKEWRLKAKKEHPIRYFIGDTIPMWFNVYVKMKFRDLIWWFKYRLSSKHKYNIIKLALKPDYYELEQRMLYANFSLLVGFVEEQCSHMQRFCNKKTKGTNKELGELYIQQMTEFVDENEQTREYYKKTLELYKWWTEDFLKRTDVYDDYPIPNKFDKNSFFDFDDEDREIRHEWAKKIEEVEEKRFQEEQEKLIELIKIRRFLWT